MRTIIKQFEDGSVSVFGLRGRGKDMLTANVVVRRNLPYVSNCDYGGKFIPLELKNLDCGRNTYQDFISGDFKYYEYPYPDRTDVYVSDAGLYFPAQYCNELNRAYPYLATFQALARQLGDCNFHVNSQAPNRVYDKIREQSDTYIRCMWCHVFGKLVIQKVILYERYESAANCVPVFPIRRPLLNLDRQLSYDLAKANYLIAHGEIKPRFLVYFNRSKYNTRIFKELLKNGKKNT